MLHLSAMPDIVPVINAVVRPANFTSPPLGYQLMVVVRFANSSTVIRQGGNFVARQCFTVEQCGGDRVQERHVLLKNLSRPQVSFLDHA